MKAFAAIAILVFSAAVAEDVFAQSNDYLKSTTVIPRCPSIDEQTAAEGQKRPDGTEVADVRPVERSVILPSAGDPPAQAGGGNVRAGIDCPMAPSHPNASKPTDLPKP